jgi:hypothetical protein
MNFLEKLNINQYLIIFTKSNYILAIVYYKS